MSDYVVTREELDAFNDEFIELCNKHRMPACFVAAVASSNGIVKLAAGGHPVVCEFVERQTRAATIESRAGSPFHPSSAKH